MNPTKACVLVNWAIIRYLQQLKLKKKILKMAMMKAGFKPFGTFLRFQTNHCECNEGRLFPVVVISTLPHAKFGPNDHRVEAICFV